jgi:acetate kinase
MKPTTPSVLTVNGGSSSIKFALFGADGGSRSVDASMGFTVGKEDNYEKAKH